MKTSLLVGFVYLSGSRSRCLYVHICSLFHFSLFSFSPSLSYSCSFPSLSSPFLSFPRLPILLPPLSSYFLPPSSHFVLFHILLFLNFFNLFLIHFQHISTLPFISFTPIFSALPSPYSNIDPPFSSSSAPTPSISYSLFYHSRVSSPFPVVWVILIRLVAHHDRLTVTKMMAGFRSRNV